MSLSRGKV